MSGNCDGDSGLVTVGGGGPAVVVCAHYVASSRCCNVSMMRFACDLGAVYSIVQITDNGATDTWANTLPGFVTTFAEA